MIKFENIEKIIENVENGDVIVDSDGLAFQYAGDNEFLQAGENMVVSAYDLELPAYRVYPLLLGANELREGTKAYNNENESASNGYPLQTAIDSIFL